MSRTLFRAAVLLALLTPLQSCAFFTYTAEPIEAWVVDAEANQPLEGVIVVAHWQLKGGLEGGNPVGQMMVLETVTDAKGRFYFPGWGPKRRPLNGELKTQSPSLLFFQNGYRYRALENQFSSKTMSGHLDSPLRSDWNGKAVKMEKFMDGVEGKVILRDFENLNASLNSLVRDAEACNWKKIPRMLLSIRKQRVFLIKEGITGGPFGISSVDQFLLDNTEKFAREGGAGCGSPKFFFESDRP